MGEFGCLVVLDSFRVILVDSLMLVALSLLVIGCLLLMFNL